MSKLYDYFENVYKKNLVVQSYLIGNTTYDKIKDELNDIISNFIFKNKIDETQNPDIYILKNDEKQISKEDIKKVLSEISKTSQFNNKKVYIIDEFEKLNDYCVNSILKTLEEPSENVYAFLITKNIDSIKSTIVSRCQKIICSSSNIESLDDNEKIELANKIISDIENNNIEVIYRNPDLHKSILDREYLLDIIKYMEKIYKDALMNFINNKKKSNLISSSDDINKISKKILILDDNKVRLNNYLNKNLSLDRLIIEMWRCNI